MVNSRPAVLITGIRQTGKSSLLQKMFPEARYLSFDNYLHAETAEANPASFLDGFQEEQIILDEVQYVPGLFRELKIRIDRNRKIPARWILTGSQKFVLMEAARESLAGRIGLIELETLGAEEIRGAFPIDRITDLLWKGGFPEIWSNASVDTARFLDDYITTYLEKDLRSIIHTPNLRDFHRFLRSCAIRCGALVNYSDMARDTGISPNTAKSWLNSLVQSGIVTLLEPWFSNISKRLAKTPKLYFNDQGLLCRLLNIGGIDQVDASLYNGAVWENFVFNELIRNEGISPMRNLFYYRDQNRVEVDFLMEKGSEILLIEAKYTEKPGKTRVPDVAILLQVPGKNLFCACRIDQEGFFTRRDGLRLYNPLKTSLLQGIL